MRKKTIHLKIMLFFPPLNYQGKLIESSDFHSLFTCKGLFISPFSDGKSWERECCCCCLVTELSLFCHPTDCSPPGSSVHGISQARILDQVAVSPGHLLNPGIKPTCPARVGRLFTTEPPQKPKEGHADHFWSWLSEVTSFKQRLKFKSPV